MTDAEWQSLPPGTLIQTIRGISTQFAFRRKARLLTCAISRQLPRRFSSPVIDSSIELLEMNVDGLNSVADLNRLRKGIAANTERLPRRNFNAHDFSRTLLCGNNQVWQAAQNLAAQFVELSVGYIRGSDLLTDTHEERKKLSDHYRGKVRQLLHDIFGNPFRPVAVDPAWFTPTAVGLARAIYGDRAFDRLPILADALQDAGCEDAAVLGHCRGDGPHVRGCWVVDLVLGKE